MTSNGDRPEPGDPEEFDFFDDFEDVGGVLESRKHPPGAFGDPDAIEDLRAEGGVVPMQGTMAPDGIAAPAPHFDALAILNAPTRVTMEEMVCLAGPCRHYSGAVVQEGSLLRTVRHCNCVMTWAEQTKLDDANVLGCNQHETDQPLHPFVEDRVFRGHRQIRLANERAVSITGHTLGVCHEASCRHYMVMVLGLQSEDGSLTPEVHRWCRKKGGAARPYRLDPNTPVLGCTAAEPGPPHDALDRSRAYLEEQAARQAAGRGYEQPVAQAADTGGPQGAGDADAPGDGELDSNGEDSSTPRDDAEPEGGVGGSASGGGESSGDVPEGS